MKNLKKNIPNVVTSSRIVACILGAVFFTIGNIPASVACYVYGAVSDAVDGFLARKLNAVTKLGKKLDPISDKIFALSLMIPAIILGNTLMIIPLTFESIIGIVNAYAELKYQKTYTEKIGKLKTIVLFPTMILGLLTTLYPNITIVFLPSLFASAKLQADSFKAYMKQLEKNKTSNYSEEVNTTKLISEDNNENKLENKIENINKCNYEKTKKLVRKKEYNDRY